MRIVVEPPIAQWRPRTRAAITLATGHQAALWHPGILAKDIAIDIAADRWDAQTVHLVVNHDVHDAITLALPVQDGDRLSVERITLGPQLQHVPTGFQPAIEPAAMRRSLLDARHRLDTRLTVDLDPLLHAIDEVGPQPNLAAQMSRLTAVLMRPYAGTPTWLDATDLLREAWPDLGQRMLEDVGRCVHHYNQAAAAYPQAGIAPLVVGREFVELPLWLIRWNQPRQRLYADVADSRETRLVREDGEPLREDDIVAPRALMLTAIARSRFDLFVHGTGGGIYDTVTDQWWQSWTGEALAPRAVVTADVHLDFDAPVTNGAELTRRIWCRHHLPHNIDRVLGVDGPLVSEKRRLLDHMDDDRDKRRRASAFRRIHQINAALVERHADAVREADQQLQRARVGITNAAIARKRDWCFALYPPEKLHALREAIAAGTASYR